MKTATHRLILFVLFAAFGATTAFAQEARIQIDHLDRLFPKAVETVDVTIDGALLKMASKFIPKNVQNQEAIKDLIATLKGVYVKGVEFEKEGEYSDADVEQVRQQLRAPGWDRIVGVRSKRDGDNAEVYLMHNGDVIYGIAVLAYDPRQFFVVNVVGPLDPEKISELVGQFGIPKDLNLDFSGATRTKKGGN